MGETVRTPLAQLVEARHPGKTLRQVLTESYGQHGSLAAVAASLGVSKQALKSWLRVMGLRAADLGPVRRRPRGRTRVQGLSKIELLEIERGRSFLSLLAEAYAEHRDTKKAARALGVSRQTVWEFMAGRNLRTADLLRVASQLKAAGAK